VRVEETGLAQATLAWVLEQAQELALVKVLIAVGSQLIPC